MLRNTESSWGSLAKTLHWVLVIMIVVEIPVGFLMAATFGPGMKDPDVGKVHDILAQVHNTNGWFILLLGGFRLTWRWRNRLPSLGSSLGNLGARLARLNHAFFYALMFLIPLSGWAALSVLAERAIRQDPYLVLRHRRSHTANPAGTSPRSSLWLRVLCRLAY